MLEMIPPFFPNARKCFLLPGGRSRKGCRCFTGCLALLQGQDHIEKKVNIRTRDEHELAEENFIEAAIHLAEEQANALSQPEGTPFTNTVLCKFLYYSAISRPVRIQTDCKSKYTPQHFW